MRTLFAGTAHKAWSSLWGEMAYLTPEADPMRARLQARPTAGEIGGLVLSACALAFFLLVPMPEQEFLYDYRNYVRIVEGDFSFYYYGYWLLPLFRLLGRLPHPGGYLLWSAVNIAGVWFAARVFGGRAGRALASFQMLYVLFFGQFTGLLMGGLALLWWGMANRRWHLAGLGMLLAAAKFHVGLPWGLFLWLLTAARWRDRLRALLIPLAGVALSLLAYPLWPLQTLHTVQGNPPNAWGSITLWQYLGPFALLLWLPPLLLPMARSRRLIGLMATACLALPYFQQADLLGLLVLPIGWAAFLGNLGFLIFFLGWGALQAPVAVPLVLYVAIVVPAAWRVVQSHRRARPPSLQESPDADRPSDSEPNARPD